MTDRVHAIVALVGARDLDRAVVVIPRAEAEEPERRQMRTRVCSSSRSAASCAVTNWSYGRSSLNARITQSRYRCAFG